MWLRALMGAKIMKTFGSNLMHYSRDTKGLAKYGVQITTLEFVLKDSTEISAERVITYNNLGCYYAEKNERDVAIEKFNKAITMCKDLGNEKMLDEIRENKRIVQEML